MLEVIQPELSHGPAMIVEKLPNLNETLEIVTSDSAVKVVYKVGLVGSVMLYNPSLLARSALSLAAPSSMRRGSPASDRSLHSSFSGQSHGGISLGRFAR
ncbi:MAG TPA: hypothetical protein VFP79_00450 [Pseudolabrys sp.]|nr:hypothetical protein [Pseudolabrys sp.]